MEELPSVLYNKFIRIKFYLTEVICQYAKNGVIMKFIMCDTGAHFDTRGEVFREMFPPTNNLERRESCTPKGNFICFYK